MAPPLSSSPPTAAARTVPAPLPRPQANSCRPSHRTRSLPSPHAPSLPSYTNPISLPLPPCPPTHPIPPDEQFSFYKSSDFNGDTLASALPAALTFIAEAGDVRKLSFLNFLPTVVRGVVRGFVRKLLGREPPAANFEDFADVLAMFKGVRGFEGRGETCKLDG